MAGRKGVENKNKVRAFDLAIKHKCDPFEVLLHFINGNWKALGYDSKTETRYTAKGDPFETDRINPELRLAAAKEAVKYIYAQQKAVEHSASDGTLLAPVIMTNGIITGSGSGDIKALSETE